MAFELRDAEVQIKKLQADWGSFAAKNYDRHKLRLINNGPSVDIGDYVVRGEVNSLIRDALINFEQLELTPVFNTIISGSSGLQNPLVESILASQDNKYDIGQAGASNRIRNIYSDITNSEQLEITDVATHTSHWKIVQDVADSSILDIKSNGDVSILKLDAGPSFAHNLTFYGNILADTDWNSGAPSGRVIGNQSGNIYLRISSAQFYAGKSGAAGTIKVFPSSGSGANITYNATDGFEFADNLTPNLDSSYDLGTTGRRWANIYADAIVSPSVLTIPLSSSLTVNADSTYDLGAPGAGARFRNAYLDLTNTENLEITDSAHTAHWKIEQDGADASILYIKSAGNDNLIKLDAGLSFAHVITLYGSIVPDNDWNSGAPSGRVIGLTSGNIYLQVVAQQLVAGKSGVAGVVDIRPSSGSAISITADSDGFVMEDAVNPTTHNTLSLGISTAIWADMYAAQITLGKAAATRLQGILDIANTTDSNIFRLQGISKDSVGAAEVSNSSLSISSSGNFYLRTYTGGDVNCTGIDDGWFGYRLDTNELQICDGGTTLSVTLA